MLEPLMATKDAVRILVVEDDAIFRDTVREILKDLGYKVRGARSLSKATKRLTRHHFDLVLSDLEIGDGTGFEVVQIARQTRPDAPIILMSANASDETTQAAMESGAARFLPKPFNLKELMASIEDCLSKAAQDTPNEDIKPGK